VNVLIHRRPTRIILRCVALRGAGQKTLALAMAAFWLLWTAIIIPAHTRGCVALDGVANPSVHSTFGGGGCCESMPMSAPTKGQPAPKQAPGGNCAICNFVAKLSSGMNFKTTLPAMGFLEIAATSSPERLLNRDGFRIFNSRAPPHDPSC
jgi:hypothetical protein